MTPKRTPVTITMPLEDWWHVLGVLEAAGKRLEPAAEAVTELFRAEYRRAILAGLSLDEIEAVTDELSSH